MRPVLVEAEKVDDCHHNTQQVWQETEYSLCVMSKDEQVKLSLEEKHEGMKVASLNSSIQIMTALQLPSRFWT